MWTVAYVGLGGALGSMARYLAGTSVNALFGTPPPFPAGTLFVNVIGCAVIGFLGGLVDTRQMFTDNVRAFVFVGVLGGFTTYSAFGYDTVALLRTEHPLLALANLVAQLVLGLGAVALAYEAAKALAR